MLRNLIAVLATSMLAENAFAQCELRTFSPFDFAGMGVPLLAEDMQFGGAIDSDGGLVVLGAMFASTWTQPATGAVFVYRHTGSDFQAEQVLLSPAPTEPLFGLHVEVDGDRLIAGSTSAVYEYEFDGAQWNLVDQLPYPELRDISLDGDRLVLSTAATGQVDVYRKGASGWNLEQSIPNPGSLSFFGASVALDGTSLAIGATGAGSASGQGLGAVYLYRNGFAGWALEDLVQAIDLAEDSAFGEVVALSGDLLMVAASKRDVTTSSGSSFYVGGVYTYRSSGTGSWIAEQILEPKILGTLFEFGSSLDLDGDLAAVGDGTGQGNSVSVYKRVNATWVELPQPMHSSSGGVDYFGRTLSLSGELLTVGAYLTDVGTLENVGAAHAFSIRTIESKGGGVAGTGGVVPHLTFGGQACPGEPFFLLLDDIAPSSASLLVAGLGELGIPFSGGNFLPTLDLVVTPALVISPTTVSFLNTAAWPAAAFGLTLTFQAIVIDAGAPAGIALSDAIQL